MSFSNIFLLSIKIFNSTLLRLHCDTPDLLILHIPTCFQSCLDHCIPVLCRQMLDRIIVQFNRTCILQVTVRITCYFIHISSIDRSDFLQLVDHPVYGCCSDAWIDPRCAVIDFFATGTVFFQYNIQKHQSLLGDPASTGF